MYVTPSETSPREWKTEFMAPIDAAAAATDTGAPSTVAVVAQSRTSESGSRTATRDRTAGRSSRLRRRVTTAPPTPREEGDQHDGRDGGTSEVTARVVDDHAGGVPAHEGHEVAARPDDLDGVDAEQRRQCPLVGVA